VRVRWRTIERAGQAPPLRFCAPSAYEDKRVGFLPGSTRTPSLPGLSQTLEGLILTHPCGRVSCRYRSWGCALQSVLPACELYQARHLAIPSRRFSVVRMPCGAERRLRPQGVLSARDPVASREYCISRCPVAFLGLFASTAFVQLGVELTLVSSSAHDLYFGALQAGLRSGSSASSAHAAQHLPLSRTLAVLAFLAFQGISTNRFP